MVVGVRLKVNGDADRPVTVGTVTEQLTEAVAPLVSVATTLGIVLWPAVIVAVEGLQVSE